MGSIVTSSLPQPSPAGKLTASYVRQLRRIWHVMPSSFRQNPAGQSFARHLDGMVRRSSDRYQHFATFFLRNRAELELLQTLLADRPQGAELKMTILACSKGAEVYSMVWAIRSSRPDLRLNLHAVDISRAIVEFAKRGIYSLQKPNPTDLSSDDHVRQSGTIDTIPSSDPHAWLFEHVRPEEMEAIFEVQGEQAVVKPWLRPGIRWLCGDANDPGLLERLDGRQEIVVANRFLCHMRPREATNCLRNIARLVAPGGYLFVSGVDLDVRTAVAKEQGWIPVTRRMREIHDGDESLRNGWPVQWWGLEPFDETRSDWQLRYASVFQVGVAAGRLAAIRDVGFPDELTLTSCENR